ncbi:MAG: hypothetical protein IT233_00485 [Bacteroidia bacterium]|nr:hypothetical protein [Bacteroidia bacterium]
MRATVFFTAALGFILCFAGFRGAGKKVSLLVAENDLKAGQNFLQHLVAYHFVDGKYQSKEKIISVPGKKEGVTGNYIRFDLGQNKIYRNRYVITGIGNVIDIRDKKVLLDRKDQFLFGRGDSLIFYTNDIFKGRYYSYLDLKTGQYYEIHDLLFKALEGQDIEVDQSSRQFKIWLYPVGKDKQLLVNDAGYGEDASARKEKSVRVPFVWLNDQQFLYPHYNQTRNICTIYKVDIPTRKQEVIGIIEQVPSTPFNSYFYKDASGNWVYVCGKGNFTVEVKKKKLSQIFSEDLGNGFTADLTEVPVSGRAFQYQGAVIGKQFCDHRRARTCPKLLAVPYELIVNGERYPQGVTVWDADTRTWKEIDVFDVAAVVGFVE